jgi:protocatechuate 3,4-dioxygenase beta subunit
MHDDDRPVGRCLTRREALALLGYSGLALATGAPLWGSRASAAAGGAGCIVRPEQTEGPFFVDEELDRSDIRSDPATGAVTLGVPLALTFVVSRLRSSDCVPLAGAQVDVWHCDGNGHYSDVSDSRLDTTGKKFLRGYQRTNDAGRASFQTIYPGWYGGRAVHIHFKLRTPAPHTTRVSEFTSQLYFSDALTDRVHRLAPYAANRGHRLRNAEDGLYRRGGSQLELAPTPVPPGYAAEFRVALELG